MRTCTHMRTRALNMHVRTEEGDFRALCRCIPAQLTTRNLRVFKDFQNILYTHVGDHIHTVHVTDT